MINVSVAFAIGLTLLNLLRPGDKWRGRLNEIAGVVEHETAPFSAAKPIDGDAGRVYNPAGRLAKPSSVEAPKATLDPLKNVAGYVPETLVEPFLKNNVITVVLLGLLGGAALRHVKTRQIREGNAVAFQPMERFVEAAYQTLIHMLHWVVQAVPFAVAEGPAGWVEKSIDLKHHLWSTESYVPWATALLAAWAPAKSPQIPADAALLNSLTQAESTSLIRQSKRDVIVAIDGMRVRSMEQYLLLRERSPEAGMRLIVWNGTQYGEVAVDLPERRMHCELGTLAAR